MIGCLIPMLALAAGGGVGALIGGRHGGYWGGGIGFSIGMVLLVGVFYAIANARHR